MHTCHLEYKEMLAPVNTDSTGCSSIKLSIDTIAVSSEVPECSLVHFPTLLGFVSEMHQRLCVM